MPGHNTPTFRYIRCTQRQMDLLLNNIQESHSMAVYNMAKLHGDYRQRCSSVIPDRNIFSRLGHRLH